MFDMFAVKFHEKNGCNQCLLQEEKKYMLEKSNVFFQ